MKSKMDCPYCDGTAVLRRQPRSITYRKEVFTIVAHYYQCERCNEEFTTTATDSVTMAQAYNQYRERHSIPFQEEIVGLRKLYSLPASKMSEILGLGANGYSNYENGEIPTVAHGNLIKAAANPVFFLHLLEKARPQFSDNAFLKAKDRLEQCIQQEQRQPSFEAKRLNLYQTPNSYTGYKLPETKKLAHMVAYFINHASAEFNDRLKLNKLLFFCDFYHYKNNGVSISGLSYRAILYGPVPTNYDNIYSYLQEQQMVAVQFLKLPNGAAREVFTTSLAFDQDLFNPEEQSTLKEVVHRFGKSSTWEVVDISHQEPSWLALEKNKALVSYQGHAFELNAL